MTQGYGTMRIEIYELEDGEDFYMAFRVPAECFLEFEHVWIDEERGLHGTEVRMRFPYESLRAMQELLTDIVMECELGDG